MRGAGDRGLPLYGSVAYYVHGLPILVDAIVTCGWKRERGTSPLIIDSVTAYLNGKDGNANHDVRRMTKPTGRT